ncbi:glycolipid 2-alpha-mannosyltransferase [Apiospora marii]|uniref:Glycolipid 2-alpha-mannosyltransferase n=1 Tax=Apiospora marii TaxID=335849 RepID=A0ABR1SH80_9PEZI
MMHTVSQVEARFNSKKLHRYDWVFFTEEDLTREFKAAVQVAGLLLPYETVVGRFLCCAAVNGVAKTPEPEGSKREEAENEIRLPLAKVLGTAKDLKAKSEYPNPIQTAHFWNERIVRYDEAVAKQDQDTKGVAQKAYTNIKETSSKLFNIQAVKGFIKKLRKGNAKEELQDDTNMASQVDDSNNLPDPQSGSILYRIPLSFPGDDD